MRILQTILHSKIYFLAILLSFALTALTIYHYPVINIDGVFYFNIANIYLHAGGWSIFSHCAWPFYPILLGFIHKLTHLDLLHIAYLLNYCFSALTVVVFVMLVKDLGGSKRQIWFGLFTILIFITFNHYRSDILRGHGYWLFYLLSLHFLFRFSKNCHLFDAILWGFSLSIAMLFRIEGALFLIFAPGVILLLKQLTFRQKFKMGLKLYIFPVVCLVIGLIFLKAHGLAFHKVNDLNRLYRELINGFLLISSRLHMMYQHLSQTVIEGRATDQDAKLFLVFGLIGLYLFDVVSVITLGFLIPICYAIFMPIKKTFSNTMLVFFVYVLINVVLSSGFFLQYRGFLSSRYVFPMALTLALLVPFGFFVMYQRWKSYPKKLNVNNILFWLTCFLMFTMLVGSLYRFGPSKVYIYKAATWIRKNTPQNAKIYTNHAVLGYLTERSSGGYTPFHEEYFSYDKIAKQPWKGYDYAIFVTDKNHVKDMATFEKTILAKPLKIYWDNHNKDQAYIFKISKE